MFLKNTWYVACMPDDFQDKPLGRKISVESMVLYRGAQGAGGGFGRFLSAPWRSAFAGVC